MIFPLPGSEADDEVSFDIDAPMFNYSDPLDDGTLQFTEPALDGGYTSGPGFSENAYRESRTSQIQPVGTDTDWSKIIGGVLTTIAKVPTGYTTSAVSSVGATGQQIGLPFVQSDTRLQQILSSLLPGQLAVGSAKETGATSTSTYLLIGGGILAAALLVVLLSRR